MRQKEQDARTLASQCVQAITTVFRGPTDHREARVVATCDAGRITTPWDHAMDAAANHAVAALALMDQLGWSRCADLVMGSTRRGYVFVQVSREGVA